MPDTHEPKETQFPGLKDDNVCRRVLPPLDSGTVTADAMGSGGASVSRRALKAQTRRDFLLYGAGMALPPRWALSGCSPMTRAGVWG